MTDASKQIAKELAALGEGPASIDELRFTRAGGAAEADPDVATVATLAEIANRPPPIGKGDALDELSRHRVWKHLAGRVGDRLYEKVPVVRGGRLWRATVGAIAIAAAVAIVPRLIGPGTDPAPVDPGAQELTRSLGEQARAGLEVLGGPSDGDRARDLADRYAKQLAAQDGGGE